MYTTKDFYYDLPEKLIAQEPIKKRDESRLLVLDKKTGEVTHKIFKEIIDYLNAGDCLVLNNTKVIPARLYGHKDGSSTLCEILLLNRISQTKWEVIVRPGKKLRQGSQIKFGGQMLQGTIIEQLENGNRIIEFEYEGVFENILDTLGEMPLPPYIHKKLEDRNRYQTIYAKYDGSAAAPTAGLHFTEQLLNEIRKKGVRIVEVLLHVGLGTFRPVKVQNILEHQMHSEYYEITKETADIINETKKNGNKIISVGTTSTRVIESVADDNGLLKEAKGWTDIFIYPGYKFKVIDSLITNFHLPESTLVMLVSTMAGKDNLFNAYKIAVSEKYRFFSFGDAMFIT